MLNRTSDYPLTFTTDDFRRYLSYFTSEFALGGMFTYRSPKEMAEGYTDPHVYLMAQLPVWKGGDQLTNSFLSINDGPTAAIDMDLDFLTGTDDYKYTRWVSPWNNVNYINVRRNDYVAIDETT
jgi:hypothetical protein